MPLQALEKDVDENNNTQHACLIMFTSLLGSGPPTIYDVMEFHYMFKRYASGAWGFPQEADRASDHNSGGFETLE